MFYKFGETNSFLILLLIISYKKLDNNKLTHFFYKSNKKLRSDKMQSVNHYLIPRFVQINNKWTTKSCDHIFISFVYLNRPLLYHVLNQHIRTSL
jgi:hypothetical protein